MNKKLILHILAFLAFSLLSVNLSAQNNERTISKQEKRAVIAAVSKKLEDAYVFPEAAQKMADKLAANHKKGQYNQINDVLAFSQMLTSDLQSVSNDKHIKVAFNPEQIAKKQQAITPEEEQQLLHETIAQNRMSNFGFKTVKILEGNVGYLDLRSFQDPLYAGETAVAAMNFLSNSSALIIDLRENRGGSPQMIQLITSYLFPSEPVHLNNFYWRPTDTHTQTWTLPHVSGKRMPEIPVYVLISPVTFSAAEEFSYNLKNLERATLVGETTGGGAHPGGVQIATDRFEVWVPSGRAINPITNTNWEGSGVSPDIEEKQEQALKTAHLHSIRVLMEQSINDNLKARYKWILEGMEAARQTTGLSDAEKEAYVGTYGPRTVTLENGRLYYQRGTNNKYPLVPMGNHKFMITEVPFF